MTFSLEDLNSRAPNSSSNTILICQDLSQVSRCFGDTSMNVLHMLKLGFCYLKTTCKMVSTSRRKISTCQKLNFGLLFI